jgi:hypothetical protein
MCEYEDFHDGDGGSVNLRNVGILPKHYAGSQPRRPELETSPPWKPQNSQINKNFTSVAVH